MSELIDRVPGTKSALAAIRNSAQTTAEFKARQRLTGRSGQLAYAIDSHLDWDYVETFPATVGPGFFSATYSLIYTSDGAQSFPIVIPSTDLRVNGESEANRLTVTPSSGWYEYVDGSGEVLVQIFELPDPAYFESSTQSAWSIDVLYRGSVTLRFKTRAYATSDGTLSIVRTV